MVRDVPHSFLSDGTREAVKAVRTLVAHIRQSRPEQGYDSAQEATGYVFPRSMVRNPFSTQIERPFSMQIGGKDPIPVHTCCLLSFV